MTDLLIYPRYCVACGKGMTEGYLYADSTYCSMTCLPITEAEWNAQYSDDGDNYWTDWEHDDINVPDPTDIKSADQAEQLAKDWQQWAGEQSLSYGELSEWQYLFEQLGTTYKLTDEFKENAII